MLKSKIKFYVALSIIAACILMLQIIQTRILSVVSWYHLAFFTISMGMFGLTTGSIYGGCNGNTVAG